MRRHNKTKKSKGSKRKGMKGLSLIKNTTKKVIPGLKTGLENIGSTVIKKTIPTKDGGGLVPLSPGGAVSLHRPFPPTKWNQGVPGHAPSRPPCRDWFASPSAWWVLLGTSMHAFEFGVHCPWCWSPAMGWKCGQTHALRKKHHFGQVLSSMRWTNRPVPGHQTEMKICWYQGTPSLVISGWAQTGKVVNWTPVHLPTLM